MIFSKTEKHRSTKFICTNCKAIVYVTRTILEPLNSSNIDKIKNNIPCNCEDKKIRFIPRSGIIINRSI